VKQISSLAGNILNGRVLECDPRQQIFYGTALHGRELSVIGLRRFEHIVNYRGA